MLSDLSARHALVAALVVAGLIAAIAVGFGGGGSPAARAEGDDASSTTTSAAGATDATSTTLADITTQTYFDPDELAPDERGPDGIRVLRGDRVPVQVGVPGLTGLRDGDAVRLHIEPDDGELLYSVDVRLCVPNIEITSDAVLSPELSGRCLLEPLTPNSDSVVRQRSASPDGPTDVTFRVGVGTGSWTRVDGQPASITCGPGHPCSLVVKFQIPYGYGYRVYPVTFAA